MAAEWLAAATVLYALAPSGIETGSATLDQRAGRRTVVSSQSSETNRLSNVSAGGALSVGSANGTVKIAGADLSAKGDVLVAGQSISVSGVIDSLLSDDRLEKQTAEPIGFRRRFWLDQKRTLASM